MNGTEITRAWEHANNGTGAIAEAVRAVRDEPDHEARGNALVLLEEARKSLNASVSLIEFQIADLSNSLRVR
ncbi:hypothetical protein OKA05_01965 [Luteolibacter arcticus]|uniref:Uncharacterized protein n=1 Tax=Luteolibacter arcticus TaxID=1581411 RepID=A0ABT3GD09_9BACT|nr:hypothetical protein [Luteolibacter arcticus]MCW1921298.1 hypothetical protein [Luteolibacter arcticus]